MRVIIYARVSSLAQSERHTIDSQLTTLRAAASSRGWALVEVIVDDGRTAKTGHLEHRDGMTRLLALARAKPLVFDAVLVVDTDRLARSEDLIERATVYGTFQRAGVLVSVAGEAPREAGDEMVQIKAMFDAAENRKRADRSRRGRQRVASEGRPPSSPPWGWAFDRASRTWGHSPGAALVREAWSRAAAGETLTAIAVDYQRRGEKTPRRGMTARGEAHRPGTWCTQSVARLIAADVYVTGRWDANLGTVIQLPPIVDADTAAAARATVAANRTSGLVKTKHVYLLEGAATCALCGSPIRIHGCVAHRPSEKSYSYVYYVCDRQRRARFYDGPACPLPRFRVEDLDARVWARTVAWISDPDLVMQANAERRGEDAGEDAALLAADLDGWSAKLDAIPALEAGALKLQESGALSEAAMMLRLKELRGRREMLERQIAETQRRARGAIADAEALRRLASALELLRTRAVAEAPMEMRRAIVRALTATGWSVSPTEVSADAEYGPASGEVWRIGRGAETPIAVRGRLIG